MTNKEHNRIMSYWYAKKHAPTYNTISRRTSKSKSTGTGQILKQSRVETQIPLEVIFKNETCFQARIANGLI